MREKLELLRDEVTRAKRLPLLQKAAAAESIAERSLDLLEALVNGAEAVNEKLKRYESDYFGVDGSWKNVKTGGTK